MDGKPPARKPDYRFSLRALFAWVTISCLLLAIPVFAWLIFQLSLALLAVSLIAVLLIVVQFPVFWLVYWLLGGGRRQD